MPEWIAIDQSTSATKAIVFDEKGAVRFRASRGHRQYYPFDGAVEHNAEEIYQNVLEVIGEASLTCKNLQSIAITNQRESFVVFDRKSGAPLHPAVVWLDRRGERICADLEQSGLGQFVRLKTGLRLDTYFPASKMAHLFRARPELLSKVRNGEALVGTVDAYLVYRLTEGAVFATDHSNASRTLLYDIHKLAFSESLCELFEVPFCGLPELRSSEACFGETSAGGCLERPLPIRGVMGDSHAALFAQRCFEPGEGKITLGTGSSLMVNAGSSPPEGAELVTALAWTVDGKPTYALEGIINCTGAIIAWLRDGLGFFSDSAQSEALIENVEDSGGVQLIPAFTGLSAPYWRPNVRGALMGLQLSTTRAHIVRAALESIAFQICDIAGLVAEGAGDALRVLHADGGMVSNALLMQMISDVCGVPVRHRDVAELSAQGAFLAGALGAARFCSLEEIRLLPSRLHEYQPGQAQDSLRQRYVQWRGAVEAMLAAC